VFTHEQNLLISLSVSAIIVSFREHSGSYSGWQSTINDGISIMLPALIFPSLLLIIVRYYTAFILDDSGSRYRLVNTTHTL